MENKLVRLTGLRVICEGFCSVAVKYQVDQQEPESTLTWHSLSENQSGPKRSMVAIQAREQARPIRTVTGLPRILATHPIGDSYMIHTSIYTYLAKHHYLVIRSAAAT